MPKPTNGTDLLVHKQLKTKIKWNLGFFETGSVSRDYSVEKRKYLGGEFIFIYLEGINIFCSVFFHFY